ncbi:prolyl oligopeptidase family serine peptidase [Flavobacterium sp. Fl-77]|uniref:prolyl oligopeptidase n=1 Tax=Flavobacterium flavipigmentatum TaxID=2893884 RepID=A0AAJ2W0T1_9FLAO|nr:MULTISPECIES: prolyl oligopeptidase family serine peptidase [unclassified Flavobacterium]MDX6181526.1 prolyl oligopeptidase family serine peptidase [Flavobacterium sp. Fl-33]MDX6185440.1 prolyl oligopeptidase family serine peptidase [Flavobacterium sp. Fl-77]UFH37543.1 prolyl oligopeptidase family serine peptidase [Flavobacterium sp. F-70]
MKINTLKKITILSLGIIMSGNTFAQSKQEKAPSVPATDTYFGIKVEDKYRNLEDLKNEQTLTWLKGQADYTNNILNSIPGKQSLINELTSINDRVSEVISGVQIMQDGTYFYQKTTPKDQVAKLYKRNGLKGKEILIFDPESLKGEGKDTFKISSFSPNKSGKLIGVNISKNGGEMSEMLLINVADNKILSDKIDKLRFGYANWLKDDKSFIYIQSPTTDIHDVKAQMNIVTKLHVVGTDIAQDKVIFSKAMYPELNVTDEEIPVLSYDPDSDMLFFSPSSVNSNIKLFIAKGSDLYKNKITWKLLTDRKDEIKAFAFSNKDIYFYTTLNSPKFKVTKTSINNPNLATATLVIPEDKEANLNPITITKDGIFYTRTKNGIESKLYFTDFDGKNHKEIKTPKKSATIALTSRGSKFSDLWVRTTGWTTKGERYKYDIKTNTFIREELSTITEYPEFENFEIEELMVKSYDGVEVPLSIIYKKGIKKDKNTPVLFYGYGAYGMSMSPNFNPSLLLWVKRGGILAIAHVRGGGELGEKWHLDGQKSTKHNTWKDVIACTEYMIKEGYTNTTKTVIYSRSAGGIFVGRAITERPDLYAVAIPGVGSMNTVRGENTPNGPVNIPEFGTMKDENDAKALIEMDSYLQLKEGVKYPATLTTAGFNDPRIIVWSPAKFAARLLEVNTSKKPTLLKVDYEAGHFGGASKAKSYEEVADVLSFALWQVGHPDFQPKNN